MLKPTIQVLLVEDNLADAQLLQRGFARLPASGWQITPVETLEEAIAACQDPPDTGSDEPAYQLVLLDLGLPDSQGLETLRQFRAAVPDLCIVVLTGLDDEDLALQSVTEGAQDYLVKDQVTVPRLSHTIRLAIERQQILTQQRQSEERVRQIGRAHV